MNKGRLADVKEPRVHYYEVLKKYILQVYRTDWASQDNSSRNLAELSAGLGSACENRRFLAEAEELELAIHQKTRDPERGFYFDLT